MPACKYCGWKFVISRRHRSEGLREYCSHGCRVSVTAPLGHQGKSHVSLDAGPDGGDWLLPEAVADCGVVPDDVVAAGATLPVAEHDQVCAFLRLWLTLRPLEQIAVAAKLLNPEIRMSSLWTARRYSLQAHHAALKRALAKVPGLGRSIKMRKNRVPA